MVRPRRLLLLAGMAAGAVAVLRHGHRAARGRQVPGGILIGDTAAVAPAGARVLEGGARRWVRWGNGDCIWVGSRSKRSRIWRRVQSCLYIPWKSVHTLEMGHAIGLPEGYRSWVAVVSQPAILGDQEAAVLHSGRVDQPVGRVAGK